jgi:paraquat-inducible protein A
MTLIRFGQKENSTIFAGVLHLIQDGAWPLGLLVFFASILVPLTKITAMFFLLIMVHLRSDWRLRDRTVLYRLTEAVGAWSMVDIYLISILIALLRMDELATIFPGAGATFFGAAVVMTMMAAHSFDPRLMWDRGIRYD